MVKCVRKGVMPAAAAKKPGCQKAVRFFKENADLSAASVISRKVSEVDFI